MRFRVQALRYILFDQFEERWYKVDGGKARSAVSDAANAHSLSFYIKLNIYLCLPLCKQMCLSKCRYSYVKSFIANGIILTLIVIFKFYINILLWDTIWHVSILNNSLKVIKKCYSKSDYIRYAYYVTLMIFILVK